MATAPLYNEQGKEAGTVELNDAVFGVKPNDVLVHQVYVALEANKREPWAHAKDRSDVRGGGRKPWRQKGTGRARHGSRRSPIWSGGGVTFGPLKNRNYKKKINTKMKQSAVRMCLSSKVTDNKFIVLETLASEGKTKPVASLRAELPGNGRSTLLLTDKTDDLLGRATRNIPGLHLQRTDDVSVPDLLNHQFIITTKAGVEALTKRLAK